MAARANTSFMLVLCLRQIPAKANKLILSNNILTISVMAVIAVRSVLTMAGLLVFVAVL